MIIAVLICAVVIYLQVRKFETVPENSDDFSKYEKFCDEICKEIERVKDLANTNGFLKERLSVENAEILANGDDKTSQNSEISPKFDIKTSHSGENLAKPDENGENSQPELIQSQSAPKLNAKSEFLSKMDDFIKEISFIKVSNINRRSSEIWEQKLFEFLDKFDKFIIQSAQNGENLAQEIRSNLMRSFR